MPRYPRLHDPGSVRHLTSKTVNGEFRILTDADRDEWLRCLGEASARSDWSPLAYAIMSNHTHLLAKSGIDPCWRITKSLNTRFGMYLNRSQGRTGPVFAQRPHDERWIEDIGIVIAYAHNNVVRAGIVSDPADSGWTSHRAYLGLVPPPPWLDVELGLSLCGFDSSPRGRLAFHDFVVSRIGDCRPPMAQHEDLAATRAAVRARVLGQVEITGPTQVSDGAAFQILRRDGVHLRARYDGTVADAIAAVSACLGLPEDALRAPSKARNLSRARRVALLAWTRDLGRPLVEMAAAVSLSPSAACELVRRGPADAHEAAAVAAVVATLRNEISRT